MNISKTIAAIALLVCVSIAVGGQVEQQQEDSSFQQSKQAVIEKHHRELKIAQRKFRADLKPMSPANKTKAIEENRLNLFRENEAFRRKLHEDDMVFLSDRLAAAAQMSVADQSDLLKAHDALYKENVLILDNKNQEIMDFFEKTAANPALSQSQKREELKSYFKQQKSAVLNQRIQQAKQRQSELQKKYSTPEK